MFSLLVVQKEGQERVVITQSDAPKGSSSAELYASLYIAWNEFLTLLSLYPLLNGGTAPRLDRTDYSLPCPYSRQPPVMYGCNFLCFYPITVVDNPAQSNF